MPQNKGAVSLAYLLMTWFFVITLTTAHGISSIAISLSLGGMHKALSFEMEKNEAVL